MKSRKQIENSMKKGLKRKSKNDERVLYKNYLEKKKKLLNIPGIGSDKSSSSTNCLENNIKQAIKTQKIDKKQKNSSSSSNDISQRIYNFVNSTSKLKQALLEQKMLKTPTDTIIVKVEVEL